MTRIKFMENVGKVATVTAVAMYVSYFPQIMNNLAHPGTGDWIQPLVAAINCTLWVVCLKNIEIFQLHWLMHQVSSSV